KQLVDSGELSVIMVTHSLGVIRQVTTEVNIMYAGTMVEGGDTKKVFEHPIHPYTEALMNCLPKLTGNGIAEGIPGRIPDYSNPPKGCRFAPRCPYALKKCQNERPVRHEVDGDHWVACFQAEEGDHERSNIGNQRFEEVFPLANGKTVKAVDGVSMKMYKGETLGLVGESDAEKVRLPIR
ncbi:MAG: oligopeptide/dipeptide ABC transporter ATP-binding protein, partial [[Clostridium] scindens]